MADDVIEGEVMDRNEVVTVDNLPGLPTERLPPMKVGLMPTPMERLEEAATMLSKMGALLPPPFQGKPDLCMGIVYQADRWGMDPVAVAQKCYLVDNRGVQRIAYEAQLIAALVQAHAPLREPLQIEHKGQGKTRHCVVVGWLNGASTPAVYASPIIDRIKPKNSPLWFNDPDQQLAYYSIRAWARRHVPGVILGVYGRDELVEQPTQIEHGQRPDPFANAEPSGGGDGAGEPEAAKKPAQPEKAQARPQEDTKPTVAQAPVADDPMEWRAVMTNEVKSIVDGDGDADAKTAALKLLWQSNANNRKRLMAASKTDMAALEQEFVDAQKDIDSGRD